MVDTATANALIAAVNQLRKIVVSPSGFGKFVVGDKEVVLDLAPLAAIITNLQKAADTINNTTVNNYYNNTTNITNITKRLNQLINSINNSSISASCNGDGTITVTQIFPNLPSPT